MFAEVFKFQTISADLMLALDNKRVKAEKNAACKLISTCRQTDLDCFYSEY